MLSCKEPGGLFAICELENGTWSVPFSDRARALPREKLLSAARLRELRAGAGGGVRSVKADKFKRVDEVGEIERIAEKGQVICMIYLEADIPQIAAVGENDVLQVVRDRA